MTSEALTPLQAARLEARRRRFADPLPYLRLALVAAFAATPLVVGSFQVVDLVLKIALFATLVASYDVVIGYTGIVSFGHAMFFGLGAYAVALALGKLGAPTYGHLLAGFAAGIALSAVIATGIGAFSLRVKAIFFAMITLAFAEFALILAVQWSQLTGGEDGLSPRLPGVFAVSWDGGRVLGVALTGRLVTYYFALAVCVLLFAAMRHFVDSPLGGRSRRSATTSSGPRRSATGRSWRRSSRRRSAAWWRRWSAAATRCGSGTSIRSPRSASRSCSTSCSWSSSAGSARCTAA